MRWQVERRKEREGRPYERRRAPNVNNTAMVEATQQSCSLFFSTYPLPAIFSIFCSPLKIHPSPFSRVTWWLSRHRFRFSQPPILFLPFFRVEGNPATFNVIINGSSLTWTWSTTKTWNASDISGCRLFLNSCNASCNYWFTGQNSFSALVVEGILTLEKIVSSFPSTTKGLNSL